jgi:hypothetical protein
MGVIDAYVAELGGALRGPRRAKADLLAEARDGLMDAARAYEHRGLDRDAAERQAVEEFGGVQEIAPGYQTELGLAQGRRTALLVFFVLAAQPFGWSATERLAGEPSSREPGPVYVLLDALVAWLGVAAIVGGLLAALACGIGVRYLGARRGLVRVTGVFALAVVGVFGVLSLLLTVLTPVADARSLLTVTGLPWTVTFLGAPLAWIAMSARRCLAAV